MKPKRKRVVREIHKTCPIKVWVDVDRGIAKTVLRLNMIRGVRTHASCQGTLGEGGPHPYRAEVMCSWTPGAFTKLRKEFDITLPKGSNNSWGYIHP
jgi:hypothetical protein